MGRTIGGALALAVALPACGGTSGAFESGGQEANASTSGESTPPGGGDPAGTSEAEQPAPTLDGAASPSTSSGADAGQDTGDTATDTGAPPPPLNTECDGTLCVFPGAEGFGATTPAGRAGQVFHVVSLEDDGPGTLREALEASGPRTVVFDVSGTIVLDDKISIREPFLTIAGQTAPSPGITVAGDTVTLRSHDVLIQHLRFRAGRDVGGDADAFNVLGPRLAGDEVHSVVIDHCSFSWGIDETLSFNYDPHDITVSAVLVSESLSNAGHSEGEHSKGLLFGNNTDRASLLRSLGAHNVDRNPFIKGGTVIAMVNNVFYDWAKPFGARLGSSDSSSWPITATIIGNVYIAGSSSPADSHAVAVHDRAEAGTRLYLEDTLAIGVDAYLNEADFDPLVDAPPVELGSTVPIDSSDVESLVLASVGARPRDRDPVDERVIEQVRTRTGSIIDDEDEVGGLPVLQENQRVFDVGDDPSGDDDGDGYTNLEERLHAAAAALE